MGKRLARGRIHALRASLQGFLNQCTADASVRACDQDCLVFDVHNILLSNHCLFYWLLRIGSAGRIRPRRKILVLPRFGFSKPHLSAAPPRAIRSMRVPTHELEPFRLQKHGRRPGSISLDFGEAQLPRRLYRPAWEVMEVASRNLQMTDLSFGHKPVRQLPRTQCADSWGNHAVERDRAFGARCNARSVLCDKGVHLLCSRVTTAERRTKKRCAAAKYNDMLQPLIGSQRCSDPKKCEFCVDLPGSGEGFPGVLMQRPKVQRRTRAQDE